MPRRFLAVNVASIACFFLIAFIIFANPIVSCQTRQQMKNHEIQSPSIP